MKRKLLVIAILAALPISAQYSASASGSTTAAAEINSKPAFQTGAGAPSGLNCTEGKDFYEDTTNHNYYGCTATGTPGSWTQLVKSGGALGTPASGTLTNVTGLPGAGIVSGSVGATQLAAQYSKGQCVAAWSGSGAANALASGDDTVARNGCYNDSGVTRTITAVKCRSDNGSNTTTVNPTFGADGTGTTILSGALTCGNSYAYSSTGTVSNASWTTGTGIAAAMGGTLTGTSIALLIDYTY